jgi:hypothetical protein
LFQPITPPQQFWNFGKSGNFSWFWFLKLERGFFWVTHYWAFLKLNMYNFWVSRNIFSHWHDPAGFSRYIKLLPISAVAEGSIYLVLHLGFIKLLSQPLISLCSEAYILRFWTHIIYL